MLRRFFLTGFTRFSDRIYKRLMLELPQLDFKPVHSEKILSILSQSFLL
jgi:hypothetical protein